ncbi:MAG: glycosyltransferase, partial [Candidatus Dormibacteria bacterium]
MTNEESPRKAGRSHPVARILQIGNYPPPVCGWAIHAQAVQNALQKRGAICKVLDIGPGRRTREEGPDCTPMRGAWDYLRKIIAYRLRGFTFEPHVNGESWQGYLLVLGAVLLGRVTGKPSVLMFHAGPTQRYFPRSSGFWRYAFSILFHASGAIVCNFESVQEEIVKYGLPPEKVHPIFSAVYDSEAIPVSLPEELNAFLRVHEPRLFSYSMFRPGYGTECMLAAFSDLRETFSRAGLLIVGP